MAHERPYQRLIVWKEAHQSCVRVYEITKNFPPEERYRLVDQMCRAAVSIVANIAEGSGKKSNKERFRFYETSRCSLEELHCFFMLAKDLEYADQAIFDEMDDRIQRTGYLIHELQSSLS